MQRKGHPDLKAGERRLVGDEVKLRLRLVAHVGQDLGGGEGRREARLRLSAAVCAFSPYFYRNGVGRMSLLKAEFRTH